LKKQDSLNEIGRQNPHHRGPGRPRSSLVKKGKGGGGIDLNTLESITLKGNLKTGDSIGLSAGETLLRREESYQAGRRTLL